MKPFLKWAGGKRQLLPHLRPYYPDTFGTYLEPFLGSGAVFFDLFNRGRLEGHHVLLADSSVDLIACYASVRDSVEQVIAALEALEAGHRQRGDRHYYEVRDERFNPLRRQLRERAHVTSLAHAGTGTGAGSGADPGSDVALAAMLIYLNRTGYNGLYRVNGSGDFNVPIGRYDRPRICDAENLRAASAALRLSGLRLARGRFLDSLAAARDGDFVYLDPPYAPVSRTASFTSYTADRFDAADHQVLHRAVIDLASRGVRVVLSNSAAAEVKALYADDPGVRRAGLRTHLVPARRAINSRGGSRGSVYEYVITNVGC